MVKKLTKLPLIEKTVRQRAETPLNQSLAKLTAMKAPSVESILRKRGFRFEADVVAEVINNFEATIPSGAH